MGALCLAANGLWLLSCLPARQAFGRATAAVAATQQDLLLALLRRNAGSAFGRAYDFAAIRSVEAYQARVPLADYDDLRPAIEAVAAGRHGVLTAEPVRLLEPTSGSTAATKLIPYTATLQAEFQRAIGPWIVDLLARDPRLLGGRAYWQVTPVARPEGRSAGGLPIGFEDDGAYLGGLQRHLAAAVMVAPPALRLVDDMEAFRYLTLLFLLRCGDLALVSVWNPTFFTLLLGRLEGWGARLAADIEAGALAPPGRLDPALRPQLAPWLRPDPRRAAAVRAALRAGGPPPELHRRLWPGLRLLSCWADGNAAPYARELAALLPQARLQPKGLIATEGFVSLPLGGCAGAALAVRSHFFEFLPEGGGAPALAHQLAAGARYAVALTTGGGLYRYRLHDLVEVTGHLGECPLVRFVGRAAQVADWFGEKLNERHVAASLAELLAGHAARPSFAMVACSPQLRPPAYTLFVESGAPDAALRELGATLEGRLRDNIHYSYCRDLGQLGPLRVFRVAGGGAAAYLERCRLLGQREGDIKPAALHQLDGWEAVFAGGPVAPADEGPAR